jgi:hypothetical protein
MSTHTVHADIFHHGLADDCPRCKEHASAPFADLDDGVLAHLVNRITRGQPPRSEVEATAMGNIRTTLHAEERLRGLRRKGRIAP